MQAMRGSQKSLILVARQLGIHIGPNDIPERFQIDDRELKTSEMCELAQSFDLKAKATKLSESELLKLLTKKQQILKLLKSICLDTIELGKPSRRTPPPTRGALRVLALYRQLRG